MNTGTTQNGIELGVTATDAITGFTGTVTGLCFYISGCNQALLVPKVDKDGGHREGHWFDIQRLKVDARTKPIKLDNGESPGFDKPAPKR